MRKTDKTATAPSPGRPGPPAHRRGGRARGSATAEAKALAEVRAEIDANRGRRGPSWFARNLGESEPTMVNMLYRAKGTGFPAHHRWCTLLEAIGASPLAVADFATVRQRLAAARQSGKTPLVLARSTGIKRQTLENMWGGSGYTTHQRWCALRAMATSFRGT